MDVVDEEVLADSSLVLGCCGAVEGVVSQRGFVQFRKDYLLVNDEGIKTGQDFPNQTALLTYLDGYTQAQPFLYPRNSFHFKGALESIYLQPWTVELEVNRSE